MGAELARARARAAVGALATRHGGDPFFARGLRDADREMAKPPGSGGADEPTEQARCHAEGASAERGRLARLLGDLGGRQAERAALWEGRGEADAAGAAASIAAGVFAARDLVLASPADDVAEGPAATRVAGGAQPPRAPRPSACAFVVAAEAGRGTCAAQRDLMSPLRCECECDPPPCRCARR